MTFSRMLDVPYLIQPTPITCQSTCLSMFAKYLEKKIAIPTAAGDLGIQEIWNDINTEYAPESCSSVRFICHDPYGKFNPQLHSKDYGKRRLQGAMCFWSGGEVGPGKAVSYDYQGIRRSRFDKHSAGTYFMISAAIQLRRSSPRRRLPSRRNLCPRRRWSSLPQ